MKYDAKDIPEYLMALPEERRTAVGQLIELIRQSGPDVEEVFRHNMPFYPLHGEPLFAVASQKHFISLYITETDIIDRYREELGKVSLGKNCIRFKKLENLNLETVKKILKESYDRRNSTR